MGCRLVGVRVGLEVGGAAWLPGACPPAHRFSFFISISAFQNAGFSLLGDNLMRFANEPLAGCTKGSVGLDWGLVLRWSWRRVDGLPNMRTNERTDRLPPPPSRWCIARISIAISGLDVSNVTYRGRKMEHGLSPSSESPRSFGKWKVGGGVAERPPLGPVSSSAISGLNVIKHSKHRVRRMKHDPFARWLIRRGKGCVRACVCGGGVGVGVWVCMCVWVGVWVWVCVWVCV